MVASAGGEYPLSHFEHQFALKRWTSPGLELWVPVPGRNSSTRTEVVAAILAVGSESPCHIGTDSANLVRTYNEWDQGLLNLGARPWALRGNGDLFQVLTEAAQKVGKQPIRI